MNNLIPIAFEDRSIRIFRDEAGEPWFVGMDVCDVLKIRNSRHALSRLPDDEKLPIHSSDGNRGNPLTTGINEPGVYRLIMTSRVEAAERFKRWLFHDALPEIRRSGAYTANKNQASHPTESKVEIGSKEYMEILASMVALQSRLIGELDKSGRRKDLERHYETATALIAHTTYSDVEIASIMENIIGDFMPEWVAWRRRIVTETKNN